MRERNTLPSPLCGGGWRAEQAGRGGKCRKQTFPSPDPALRPGHPPPQRGEGMRVSRRALLVGAGAAAFAPVLPLHAVATEGETESHGLSIFGDLKYGPDFRHFDYVNPQAPKGGAFSAQISSVAGNQNFETFNTLNIFVLRGDGAAGMGLTFDSLMARSLDEPDAMYGVVARAVRWSGD